ncbi:MAG: glutathione S-transferase family protein [Proteobacteria bacterium]|nr:glutathione S-transferase family protein [Pseudomonadota bacterium]
MNAFVVHSIPGSPFGRAVLAALEEKRTGYRLIAVAPPALRAPEHLARHPFGRVPVLEHGDYRLYETQAILRYLDRVLPEPALTPADARAAGRMDQALNVNDWYLFQGVANVIAFQRIVRPQLMGLAADEAAIGEAMPRAAQVFAELARLLGEQPFFAGAQLSLADLAIAAQLDFFLETPEWPVLAGPHPGLAAWLGRMRDRPSLRATTWERVAALAAAG